MNFENGYKPEFQMPHVWADGGLTKREYFAGLAMQGILSNSELFNGLVESNDGNAMDVVAVAAANQADAMLAELEKTA